MKKKAAKKKKRKVAKKKKPALLQTKKKSGEAKPAARPKKQGRRDEYKPAYAQRAMGYATDGSFSSRDLAKKFKVNAQTILNWRNEHPEFAQAIETGKQIAVDDVEKSYFQIACGTKRTKREVRVDDEGGITTTATVEKVLPNPGACKGILAAHRRKVYGDKVKLDGNLGLTLTDVAAIVAGKKKNG